MHKNFLIKIFETHKLLIDDSVDMRKEAVYDFCYHFLL